MTRVILVLGGQRSGKSDFAQTLAQRLGEPVLFVATAEARDAEMTARIAAHRASRPATWRTAEAARDLAQTVAREVGDARTVLVDCLTLLVSNCMDGLVPDEDDATWVDHTVWPRVERETSDLLDVATKTGISLIIVSNEVGMGLVPSHPAGRVYRDVLGRANQAVASVADAVLLMVAGIPVDIKQLARIAHPDLGGPGAI